MPTFDYLLGLLPIGTGLAYETRLNGRLVSRSDLVHEPSEEGTLLRMASTTDLAAAGVGPGSVDDVAELLLSAEGRPVRFVRESGGRRLTIAIGPKSICMNMPDGSSHTVETGAIDGVIDTNLPGLTALLIASLVAAPADRDGVRLARVLVASQGLAIPYRIYPGEIARTWSTGFDEIIEVDEAGLPVAITVPKQKVTTVRVPILPTAALATRFSASSAAPAEALVVVETRSSGVEDFVVEVNGIEIHGVISRPAGAGPHPAVLLVPGSGSVDRFGLAGDIDTGLRQIGNGLTKRGFLAATADKAGAGLTRIGNAPFDRGFQVLIEETRAIFDALAARADVDPRRVGLIGHSLGGVVAVEIARSRPQRVGGLALLATPGRPIDAVIIDQLRQRGRVVGLEAALVEEQIADLRRFIELACSPEDWREDRVPERFLAAARARRWMAELVPLDPAERLAGLACPVFLAIGTVDVQISEHHDLGRLHAAAPSATVHRYEGLDHLMMPSTTEAGLTAYAEPNRRVPDVVADDLAAFFHAPA